MIHRTQPGGQKAPSQSTSSAKLLPGSAAAFENLTETIFVFSSLVPARTSIRQVMAFAIIAQKNAMGSAVSLTDVREIAGEALGQSIERTIQQFFAPTVRDPDALGWLEQEEDPYDRRKKYLKLTDKGVEVVNAITTALSQKH